MSANQRIQISNLIKTYGHLFPTGNEKNLVHGDFDPANILVKETNNQLMISGILDWEFSFAGSTLCDVANMLRYAEHRPNHYEQSFLAGLKSEGYDLPVDWRPKIHLLNLVSLLDCLQRSDPKNQPNRITDIKTLINSILFNFKI